MAAQNTLPLRDIHLPDQVSWWPLAPGWWFIISAVIALTLIYFISKALRKKTLLRKAALAQLDRIQKQFEKDGDKTVLVQSLSILMRRSCISFYPRASTAGLTGDRWLHYLDNTSAKKEFTQNEFTRGTGKILATAPYLPAHSEPDLDADKLLFLCKNWLLAQPHKNKMGNIPESGVLS